MYKNKKIYLGSKIEPENFLGGFQKVLTDELSY